ncbi:TIGR02301 family protein [Rhabdaerophilum sp. SD176]|uniref:TIGR02301 family protein n=1 Tax=Rhabdaerophilum sp. SD176 TaxID=2983548 RepID=UPI0024E01EA3|nr:TIGR02301 family protein [Rhabdaerophilum sp. SD176]
MIGRNLSAILGAMLLLALTGSIRSVAQETPPSRIILTPSAPAQTGPVAPLRARPSIRRPAGENPVASRPAPPVSTAQEKPLVDLSEVVGALAFLSQLCQPGAQPNPWRARMEVLLEAEGEPSGAREKMAGAFNTGFSDYATTYRQCTPAAEAARLALTREAARLARELERRFGS